MGRVRFRPGTKFLLRGEWFIIREVLIDHQLLLENRSSGGKVVRSVDELTEAFFQGELRFEVLGRHTREDDDHPVPIEYTIKSFEALPEEWRDEAWRRYQIIRPLLDLPSHERTREKIEEYVRQLQEKRGILEPAQSGERKPPRKGKRRGDALSRTSVERWIKYFLDSGQDIRSLVDETYKCGRPGEKRLDPEIEHIIQQVLDECEENRRYRTGYSVYLMVVNRIAEENRTRPKDLKLGLPGETTVYRRVRERGTENIIRRRRSRVERQADEPVQPGPPVTRIMQRVEFDGTPLDLIVVDEKDRLPIGRPVLVYGLDCYSGYPLGYYVGFEPASYKTTMLCMLHCISPKPDTRRLYGTKNLWLARGLPELAMVDNGREFVNRHLHTAFGMLGVPIDQCPVRTPWFKGAVERFFRSNNTGLTHELRGTTFSNVFERGDYNPEKDACISLTAFIKILHIFLLDYYAQNWHAGIQGIPAKKWEESERNGFIPCLPASLDDLRITLCWSDERTLQRIGIEYESITYRGHDLGRLRSLLKREDRKVSIRVNPDDLSCIYVLDPLTEKDWLRFDANDDIGYTQGLSLWKHRIIRKRLLREKHENVDIYALADAKARIQEVVEEEYLSTRRIKRRKGGKRFLSDTLSANQPPEWVTSRGIILAPPVTDQFSGEENASEPSPLAGEGKLENGVHEKRLPESKPTTGVQKPLSTSVPAQLSPSIDQDDDDFDENGWGSDYSLPQRE